MKKNSVLKKIAAAAAATVMLSVLGGCGEGASREESEPPTETVTSAAETELLPPEPVNDEIRDIPSIELVKEIKIGWSLGNTLDANGERDLTAETSWGNPVTTKEMITAVKDAGFNIIRIPVTWAPHLRKGTTIKEDWLNRVQQVVNYAYEQDMFVILNLHHEDWHDPYYDTEAEVTEKLKDVWTQIGTRFEGYSEKLIFEGMNEPRMRNTGNEWNGGNSEGHDVVNHLNAAFVETIRGLGGNNAKRHLMIPTYAASSNDAPMKALVIPEGDDKIIVSVHSYSPYNFALGGNMSDNEFPKNNNQGEIDWVMGNIKKFFIDKNIPVIMGEFGARAKDNTEARVEWAEYYVRKAKEIGVPCLVWDNGAFEGDGENFGLLNRETCQWTYPEIVEAFMKGLE